jgi:hypothetical protein
MDNPETGDVSFQAQGRTFTLRYTVGAFVALENFLDRGIIDIYDELATWSPPFDPETRKPVAETPEQVRRRVKNMRVGFMRAVFWAGLHDQHREVTLDQAGDLMTEIGGMMAAYRLVVQGISLSKSPAGSEDSARPPKRPSRGRTG